MLFFKVPMIVKYLICFLRLYMSRSNHIDPYKNPTWPPKVHATIAVKMMYDKNLYVGKVLSDLENSKIIIKLLNNTDYYDPGIEQFQARLKLNSARGYMIVVPSFGWQYLLEDKVDLVLRRLGENITQGEDKTYGNVGIDITGKTEAIYQDTRRSDARSCDAPVEDLHDPNVFMNDEERMKYLFGDKDVEFISNGASQNPSSDTMLHIKNDILEKFYPITNEAIEYVQDGVTHTKKSDERYLTSKQLTVDHLMTNEDDINREGEILINALKKKFNNADGSPITDLIYQVYNGYVHITRNGLQLTDLITEDLVPDLKIFNWQYGKQIEYDTLKHIVLSSSAQQQIGRVSQEMTEVERILSQEYMIILQPQPKYIWWCLKRLIACWYSSQLMINSIKKIKILINTWRGDSRREHNSKYGTLPIIVIYPRYGTQSAKEVYTTLSKYYSPYHNAGWRCSKPSYCKKVTDLIWYTNGNLDLKYYYRHITSKDNVGSNVFTDNYSTVRGADHLVQNLV